MAPGYKEIAAELQAQIESGALQPGSLLPKLTKLTEQYGVARQTARSAIAELTKLGLVTPIRRRGTIVRKRPHARRYGIDRYSRSTWLAGKPLHTAEAEKQGYSAGQQLRELAEVGAPPPVAERFGIALDTPVWVRRRITMVNNRPDQLADSFYELDVTERAPRIREENTGPGGGFARLEEAGFHLEEISEEWAIRMPTASESSILHLPVGTPVLDLIRTTFSQGQAVEVMLAVIAGDMVSMSYKFPIPD